MRHKALIAAAVAALAASAGTANASPVASGCPAGFTAYDVGSFPAPYVLPGLVDGAGNDNGVVCAFALPDAVRDASCRSGDPIPCELEQLGLPIYRFVDDIVPEVAR